MAGLPLDPPLKTLILCAIQCEILDRINEQINTGRYLPATDTPDGQFDFIFSKLILRQKFHVQFHFLLLVVNLQLDFIFLLELSALCVQLCTTP